MTFNLFVPLIFLDLFIAIILEGFEQMSKNVNVIISEFELEKFRDCWAEFDNNVSYFRINGIGDRLYQDPRFPKLLTEIGTAPWMGS
jgi:hypothetical protein